MPKILRNAAIGVAALAVAAVSTFTAVNANAATSPPQITPVTAQPAAAPAGTFTLAGTAPAAGAAAADDEDGPCLIYVWNPDFNPWGNITGQVHVACPFQMQHLYVDVNLDVNGSYVTNSFNWNDVIASYSVDVLSTPVSCFATGGWSMHISASVTEPDGSTRTDEFDTEQRAIVC